MSTIHAPLPTTPGTTTGVDSTRHTTALARVAAVTRLSIGFVFLWAFFDKLFALGFNTGQVTKGAVTTTTRFGDAAWINGGSPTKGFLSHASGPFADFYGSFAGATWANWGFMLALFAIGAALMLGIGMRLATIGGGLLLVLMWTAVLPPDNSPFMDDHLIYAMTLVVLTLIGAGKTFGFGRRYERLPIVARHDWLK